VSAAPGIRPNLNRCLRVLSVERWELDLSTRWPGLSKESGRAASLDLCTKGDTLLAVVAYFDDDGKHAQAWLIMIVSPKAGLLRFVLLA
jgi:hypothetical protein